jgi:hypothetical protein
MRLEMVSPFRREEGFVFLSRRYICCTAISQEYTRTHAESRYKHCTLRTPYRLCHFNTLNNTYARYTHDTMSMQASAARRGSHRKHCVQQFVHCYMRIRCRRSMFTQPMPCNQCSPYAARAHDCTVTVQLPRTFETINSIRIN